MMANSNNVLYGISFPSAWCILVCCSLLFMGMPTVLGDDVVNPGSAVLYFTFGDSKKTNVGQTVNNLGSGDDFITYGDCSNSKISTTVYGIGSGDTYLMYGSSSGSGSSSANMGGEWPQNMNNLGSGDSHIKYGSCSSSSASTLDIKVYNRGSGDVRIYYSKYNRSKVTHKFNNVGSGEFFVKYAN